MCLKENATENTECIHVDYRLFFFGTVQRRYRNDFMIYFIRPFRFIFILHSTPNNFKHRIIFAQFFGIQFFIFIILSSSIKMRYLFHEEHTKIDRWIRNQQCRWYRFVVLKMVLLAPYFYWFSRKNTRNYIEESNQFQNISVR